MPRASQPTVQGLMISRMDSMESNLVGQLHEVKHDLSEKITAVEQRVIVQNSRIGKCETKIAERDVEASVSKRYSGRAVAMAIVTAGMASPALIKLIEAVVAWFQGAKP